MSNTTAWDVVCRADCPNLGVCIDSFHILAAGTASTPSTNSMLRESSWSSCLTSCGGRQRHSRSAWPRHARTAFSPGEGVHTDELVQMVLKLDALAYAGDYSFEVFNDDYVQMPLAMVSERARRSAVWLAEDVLRRSLPLPNQLRLRSR